MRIEIEFLVNKAPLVYEANSLVEAIERAVKERADLTYADLRNAELIDVNLAKADLSNADLSHANLSHANLDDVDLRGTSFSDSNLSDAIVRRSDLTGANLSGTDLRWANLFRSNLSDIDLSYTNLVGTVLAEVKVHGKQLWSKRPFLSIGQCGSVNRITLAFFFEDGSEPLIMCGCFNGGLKEFKERIEEEHSGTFHEEEYNAMVAYIQAIYKIQQEEN